VAGIEDSWKSHICFSANYSERELFDHGSVLSLHEDFTSVKMSLRWASDAKMCSIISPSILQYAAGSRHIIHHGTNALHNFSIDAQLPDSG